MMSHFRLVYCVIWTASLTYVTNGAPAAEMSMLNRFLMEFKECQFLNCVALPVFKSDDGSGSNTDPQGNYDLSVPLEICDTTAGEDNTAVPICNEAFEMMHNLSTCRDDMKVLKEAIPSSFKTIAIGAQVYNVCEDFALSQSILAQKEKYVAFKFADKAICPMVCNRNVAKACAFLLWGYKVQAKINAALHSSVAPNQSVPVVQNQGVPVAQNAEVSNQNGKHTISGGSPDVASRDKQPVDNTLAQKVKDLTKPGEHGISRSPADLETSHSSPQSPADLETSHSSPQSPADNSKPFQLKLNELELEKNKLKKSEVSKDKSGVSDLPKTESKEVVVQKTEPEDVMPPKTQTNDHRLLVKTNVISTPVAGRSATVSLSSTSENGKGQHVLDGHHEQDSSDAKTKISTAASSANSESHKSTLENAEEKPHSDETNKEIDNNKPNVGKENVDAIGKEGKGTFQSGSSIPEEDGVELPDISEVSPVNQEYTEEAVSPDSSVKDSAKNKDKNDDPPHDTENKSNPDTAVKDTSSKELDPENSASETPVVAPVSKINSEPENSPSKGISGTSGVAVDQSQPVDKEDHDEFGIEGNVDNYNDNDDQVNMEESPLPILNNHEDDTASKTEKLKSQTNNDANKTPLQTFDKINGGFPEQEDTHFFFYFVTIVIFAIGGYVLFHNKQKIFALIIEGRHERRRRSGASYRKLETK